MATKKVSKMTTGLQCPVLLRPRQPQRVSPVFRGFQTFARQSTGRWRVRPGPDLDYPSRIRPGGPDCSRKTDQGDPRKSGEPEAEVQTVSWPSRSPSKVVKAFDLRRQAAGWGQAKVEAELRKASGRPRTTSSRSSETPESRHRSSSQKKSHSSTSHSCNGPACLRRRHREHRGRDGSDQIGNQFCRGGLFSARCQWNRRSSLSLMKLLAYSKVWKWGCSLIESGTRLFFASNIPHKY